MERKIILFLLCFAIAVGFLSGCVEEQVENQAPVASFTYSPMDNIYADTEITFTDTSTDEDGTIASWSWDFGDDGTSTEQNPTHAYAAVGPYTVALIVTDDDGNASEADTVDITVSYIPPTVDFTYDPMVNITNTTEVTFTDNSTAGDANITDDGFSWDFDGDGIEDANESTATYTFTEVGDHDVTLTVTDENLETASATKTITVTAAE